MFLAEWLDEYDICMVYDARTSIDITLYGHVFMTSYRSRSFGANSVHVFNDKSLDVTSGN